MPRYFQADPMLTGDLLPAREPFQSHLEMMEMIGSSSNSSTHLKLADQVFNVEVYWHSMSCKPRDVHQHIVTHNIPVQALSVTTVLRYAQRK